MTNLTLLSAAGRADSIEGLGSVETTRLRAIISELRQQLREVSYAIWVLEGLAGDRPRRGRPQKIPVLSSAKPGRAARIAKAKRKPDALS